MLYYTKDNKNTATMKQISTVLRAWLPDCQRSWNYALHMAKENIHASTCDMSHLIWWNIINKLFHQLSLPVQLSCTIDFEKLPMGYGIEVGLQNNLKKRENRNLILEYRSTAQV